MGMFEWVDPTREALQKYLRGRTDFIAALPGAAYSFATDPKAREKVNFDEYDKKYGKPFTVGTPEQQAARDDMVQSLWNPAGMFAGATKAVVGMTKFEKAHKVAQKNAVEMLGLPPNNTAADRAAAMGFGPDLYHGTERLDRVVNDWRLAPKRATSGPMPFLTDSPNLASGYSTSKADTSRIAADMGEMARYFTVSPKDMGVSGRAPYTVEQTWWRLTPEQQATIKERIPRIGYQNLDEATGPLTLHPAGVDASIADKAHWEHTLKREANGNPLSAIRSVWGESGAIFGEEEKLADIYKLAGYPFPVSQEFAPWYKANGLLTARARISNPLDASNTEQLRGIVPALEEAFKKDRSRKQAYGADQWDKNLRYTPKEWVEQLKADIETGANSHVWTSIPDKVSEQLRKLGFDGILDISGKMGGENRNVVIPLYHNQVRSKFAAFDPKRKEEADLLAGYFGFQIPTTEDR